MEDKKSNKRKRTKEDLEQLKKKNESILEKVKTWQAFPYVRPLMCRQECCDGKLKPKQTKTRIMLQCPKCKKVQNYVPRIVLKTRLSIPEVVLRNKGRYSPTKDVQ